MEMQEDLMTGIIDNIIPSNDLSDEFPTDILPPEHISFDEIPKDTLTPAALSSDAISSGFGELTPFNDLNKKQTTGDFYLNPPITSLNSLDTKAPFTGGIPSIAPKESYTISEMRMVLEHKDKCLVDQINNTLVYLKANGTPYIIGKVAQIEGFLAMNKGNKENEEFLYEELTKLSNDLKGAPIANGICNIINTCIEGLIGKSMPESLMTEASASLAPMMSDVFGHIPMGGSGPIVLGALGVGIDIGTNYFNRFIEKNKPVDYSSLTNAFQNI